MKILKYSAFTAKMLLIRGLERDWKLKYIIFWKFNFTERDGKLCEKIG